MKSLLKHPLLVAIIGTVLGTVIATYLVSYINSISIVIALNTILGFIINVMVTVLTFSIPLYVILIILFILILILILKLNIKDDTDSFLNYKEDVIEAIRWKWEWIKIYGKYDIKSNLPIPLCNNCKGDLIEEGFNRKIYLYCENCEFKKLIPNGYRQYQDKIKREIYRRIRVKLDL